MNPPANPRTLLDELEARQNEVIDELDKLNERIEGLLKECTAKHTTETLS